VADELKTDGFEFFLPTFTERIRWSDREKTTVRPLFPGYLFSRFTASQASAIRQTRGLVKVLSIDQQPVSISDDEIASLRILVDSPAPVTPCRYLSGVPVRVECGPYAGATGVVISTRGKSFLTINIETMGRACRVEFDIADVKKTSKIE